jgi:hypothetical protein
MVEAVAEEPVVADGVVVEDAILADGAAEHHGTRVTEVPAQRNVGMEVGKRTVTCAADYSLACLLTRVDELGKEGVVVASNTITRGSSTSRAARVRGESDEGCGRP